MEILTKQANMTEAYITESYVEKEEEIATLTTTGRRSGSVVFKHDTEANWISAENFIPKKAN